MPAAKPRSRPGQRRCIVVGAGLAGLTAAYELGKRGWEVEVLEAHPSHIGGRVFTYEFPAAPGLVCELGAEWIGADHATIIALAEELQLNPRQDHHYSFCFWDGGPTSRWYGRDAVGLEADPRLGWDDSDVKIWNAFQDEYLGTTNKATKYGPKKQKAVDQVDWWTCLAKRGLSEKALLRCDAAQSTDFGESIRHVGAFNATSEYFASNSTDEVDFKIEGGNHRLIDKLEAAIGQRSIRTGAEVVAIQQGGGQVTAALKAGAAVKPADACVCAIPACRLRRIDWQPRLPDRQALAADQLQYGRIMKSAVLFGERFWPAPDTGDGFAVVTNRDTDFCFESTHGQGSQDGPGILCSYAIGDKADDLASEPDPHQVASWITQDVLGAIQNMVPAPPVTKQHVPLDIATRAWQLEEFIGGAFALFRPGQWFAYQDQGLLTAPHKRVHFAGEHLADAQGFMEGAVATGVRAAKEIDKALGP
jgi:monoamine oxidase